MLRAARQQDSRAMKGLNGMFECRPVTLHENVGSDFDNIAGIYAYKEIIECCMVQAA